MLLNMESAHPGKSSFRSSVSKGVWSLERASVSASEQTKEINWWY